MKCRRHFFITKESKTQVDTTDGSSVGSEKQDDFPAFDDEDDEDEDFPADNDDNDEAEWV